VNAGKGCCLLWHWHQPLLVVVAVAERRGAAGILAALLLPLLGGADALGPDRLIRLCLLERTAFASRDRL
jgi:hypothetical protein